MPLPSSVQLQPEVSAATIMSVTPATMRRLMRELGQLKNNPPEGIRVVTSEDNMLDVTGIIEGPEGTPYAGGYFRVKFKFMEEFPAVPPKCWFTSKIFHPNVSGTGEICVNTLKKDWKSSYGIGHILVTVKCLLIYPNPESALDEEAGKLLLEDYDSYCERARLITSVHATPRVPPPEFETPSPSENDATPSNDPPPKPTLALPPSLEITLPVPTSRLKSASPAPPPSQPLQSSAANTLPTSNSTSSLGDKSRSSKENVASPTSLGAADSNVGGPAVANAMSAPKAVKRVGAPVSSGIEKRKKALKRL